MVNLQDRHDAIFDKSSTQDFEQKLGFYAPYFHGVKNIIHHKTINSGKSGAWVFLVGVETYKPAELRARLITTITQSINPDQFAQLRAIVFRDSEAPTLTFSNSTIYEEQVAAFVNTIETAKYQELVKAFVEIFPSEKGRPNARQFLTPFTDGPYYLKIYRDRAQAAVYERLRRDRLDAPIYSLMRPEVDVARVGESLMVMYQPASNAINPEKVASLRRMIQEDWERAQLSVKLIADQVRHCYADATFNEGRNPHDVLSIILRKRRVEGDENVQNRTIDLMRIMGMPADTRQKVTEAGALHIPGELRILPNPVAYLNHRAWWRDALNIGLPESYVHGDLHCENIICRTDIDPASEPPELIDFDDPGEGPQSIFFDYLYLEFDLILKALPPENPEKRRSLLKLLNRLMSDVLPTGGDYPVDQDGRAAFELVKPLREACAALIATRRDDYENAFWLTATAVGLNYLRKVSKSSSGSAEAGQYYQRLLGWVYAAYALDRALKLHDLTIDDRAPLHLSWTEDQAVAVGDGQQDIGPYLQELAARLSIVNLAELSRREARAGAIHLSEVFVPLYTNVKLEVIAPGGNVQDWDFIRDRDGQAQKTTFGLIEGDLLESWTGDYLRRVAAGAADGIHSGPLDARVAAALAQRLVLIGEPGSGKSTVLRYLALCLAGQHLDDKKLNHAGLPYWPHGAIKPIYLEFSALVNTIYSSHAEREVDATTFYERWTTFLEAKHVPVSLSEALGDGEAMLLIDGVDEVADFDRPERQTQIQAIITELVRLYPNARIVITTRPYGRSARVSFQGFVDVRLEQLRPQETHQLARHLIAGAVEAGKVEAELANYIVWMQPIPEEIKANPLLSSLMMAIWLEGDPQTRDQLTTKGKIYREAVRILVRRFAQPGSDDDRSRLQSIGVDEALFDRLLETLAYRVHSEARVHDDAATFESGLLMTTLRRNPAYRRDGSVDYDRLANALSERSGLIQNGGDELFKFTHLSFQEHLAARYLSKLTPYPDQIKARIRENPLQWRNVIELLPDELLEQRLELWPLIEKLLPSVNETLPADAEDSTWYGVFYAVQLLEKTPSATLQALRKAHKETIRYVLREIVNKGVLSAQDRLQMAELLAGYGDDRPGVGLSHDTWLPNIVWCEVPAGRLAIGRRGSEVGYGVAEQPAAFKISKYPITVAQFMAFVRDGGYEDSRYWPLGRNEPYQPAEGRDLANHPVTRITWRAATAYCYWLTEKLNLPGMKIRLPSETQWELAARGTDGRIFLSGQPLTAEQGNLNETGLGRIAPVGMFPAGTSPYGVSDMVGNVWEMTRTVYRKSFEEAESYSDGNKAITLRGGDCFMSLEKLNEEGMIPRKLGLPGEANLFDPVGFRVVAVASEEGKTRTISTRTVDEVVRRHRATQPMNFNPDAQGDPEDPTQP
jgi:formylglycine-generating enzyme required for sulfatase activity